MAGNNVRTDYTIGLKDDTRAGFQSIERNLSTLKGKFADTFAVLGGAGIAAAGIAGLSNAVSRAVELGDKLKDISTATGQSVEALSFLNYAAENSGTSIEALNKAFVGLSKALDGAASGSAPAAAAAFEKLGLSVKQLSTLDLPTALSAIGEKLKALQNPYERAATGAAIFGKAYQQTAALILEGNQGVDAMIERFTALNGALSGEQANTFDAFNDSLGNLKAATTAAGASIGQYLLPPLTSLIEAISNVAGNGAGFLEDSLFAISETSTKVAINITKADLAISSFLGKDEAVAKLTKRIADLNAELALTQDARQGALDQSVSNRADVRKKIASGVAGAPIDTTDAAGKTGSGGKDPAVALVLDFFKEAEKEKQQILKETADVHDYLQDEMLKRARDSDQAQTKFLSDRRALIESLRTPTEQYADQVKLLLSYDLSASDLDRGLNKAREDFEATGKAAEKANTAAHDLGLTFSSAFEDAIVSGKSFSDILQSIGQDILRITTQNLVTEPLKAGLDSAFKADSISGFFSSLFKPSGARANGGPVSAGRAYLVGERGPEMIIPGSNGTVIPNGGGGVTINNYGAAPAKVRERTVNGRRQIDQFFADAAGSSTASGMLRGLGIVPPLASR